MLKKIIIKNKNYIYSKIKNNIINLILKLKFFLYKFRI